MTDMKYSNKPCKVGFVKTRLVLKMFLFFFCFVGNVCPCASILKTTEEQLRGRKKNNHKNPNMSIYIYIYGYPPPPPLAVSPLLHRGRHCQQKNKTKKKTFSTPNWFSQNSILHGLFEYFVSVILSFICNNHE